MQEDSTFPNAEQFSVALITGIKHETASLKKMQDFNKIFSTTKL